MPSSSILHVRSRTVLFISICVALVAFVSLRPSHQYATAASDKGAVTPAGNTITVNITTEVVSSIDGLCSLREAITAANTNTASGAIAGECAAGSSSGSDTINFSVTSTISLASALPDITSDLTINGPGANALNIQRNTTGGTPNFRIFTIGSGSNVIISGLTISNGNAGGSSFPTNSGGGILNSGTLTLVNSVISGNTATGSGGGIYVDQGTLISNSSVINGNNAASGAGISNQGTTTINQTTVSGNTAVGSGGGISNSSGGNQSSVLTVNNSTIANNASQGGNGGGGIFNIGQASASNSTISSNTAGTGGGISNFNPMTLTNVTISGNTGTSVGGGIYNPGIGTVTFGNTIIAGNTSPSGPDCNGFNLSSQDYNLIGNTSAGNFTGTTTHNIVNVNARLGVLANNGGTTLTYGLLDGSPAIDAGNSVFTTDQTGQPRPIDHANVANAAGGNASDIGAYEAPAFQVNSIGDTNDGACTLAGAGNGCTLREAINAANSQAGADLITFAPGLTSSGPATISLLTALPDLSSDMTITGPSASLLTVQRSTAGGTPNFRIFTINSGTTVNISGLTISSGNLPGGQGGGIFNSGTLKLSDSNVYGNSAGTVVGSGLGGGVYNAGPSLILNNCNIGGLAAGQSNTTGASGGGVFNSGGTLIMNGGSIVGNSGDGMALNGTATLNGVAITNNIEHGNGGAGLLIFGTVNIINCLIANNTAAGGDGGGIRNSLGTTTIVNSTISGNTTISSAGGIENFNATLTLTNVTVTNNRSDSDNNFGEQGGGISGGGLLKNSIVSGNFRGPGTTADDILFPVNSSSSFNLIGACNGCGLSGGVNNNQVGVVNPGLGPLTNNGGPTLTHALLAGSPAFDAGSNAFVVNPPFSGPPFTDQRASGFNRIVDGPDADATATVDIGAFEQQVSLADISSASTNEDTQLIVPFEANDTSSITSVTAISDNPTLLPNDPGRLSVAVAGTTGVVTINPATNLSGTSNITVTVNRTGGGSASKTFLLTVNPVNDVPSFTRGADQIVNEDAPAQTIANWATNVSPGPSDESSQTLSFQVTGNTNAALFAAAPAISSTGTLTYTPAANANGSATITVVLKDNGGPANGGVDTSAPQTFTITVNPVNDAPSFTKGANQTVNEDAGVQIVGNWATSILAGPANESGQILTFQVTSNSNAALFSSAPAISSTGTLTYTPAANSNGSATLTINLKDDGGVANGGVDTSASQTFTITVNSVNDAPSFTKGADQTVNNNAGAQTVNNWATNISAGPANESGQTLSFQVTANSNPSLFTVAPTISATGTLSYQPAANAGGTAAITITLKDNGGTLNGGQDTSAPQTFNINVTAIGGSLNFSSPAYGTTESSGSTTITVRRTGDTSRAVTVDYATSGDTGLPCSTPGAASPKCDFTSALGTLKFAAGEDTRTFTVLISQDSFVEGPESFTVTLSNQTGGSALATPATAMITIADDVSEPSTNAIDDASNFVRQNYHDFLNREPDASGLAFWTNQITSCGSDQACIELRRINVSAAFFLSIEFQGTGYLVERLYKTSYGDVPGASTFGGAHQLLVPIVRFNEFLPDTQEIGQGVIVGQTGWEMALENSKLAFVAAFVQRARFTTALPTLLTPAQFVDQLNTNAGNVLSANEKAMAIALFGSAMDTSNLTARAQALRQIAEDADLNSAEFNRAFVLMQYFGYMRRNPNDPQDTDYSGYDFWLTKLNQFNGNFVNADMVKAFITSAEYRQHFGP